MEVRLVQKLTRASPHLDLDPYLSSAFLLPPPKQSPLSVMMPPWVIALVLRRPSRFSIGSVT